MKQLIQNLNSGETFLEDVPLPSEGYGKVLIKTSHSLVSLGTEKMLVGFGKANWIQKAKSQPEKVKQVIQKIKTDGFQPTVNAVIRKLDTPIPLGYSQSGIVVDVGAGVTEFKSGDRVVSNGPHAEFVCIPKNLVAKIPDTVSFEEASFAVVGSIGLQGIRLTQPTYGETVVVFGLGLIGLITIQLLKANGCQVIGLDVDEHKILLAQSLGCKSINISNSDPVPSILNLTRGIGADAVIITASNSSNLIIQQAAQMSRKKGRIVLVGVVGLDIDRTDFYKKELAFQVSCSYGPGRYEDDYEQRGIDYPIGYVRWTQKRNIEAVLQSIADGHLNVQRLITEKVKLEEFQSIYKNIDNNKSIASILEYQDQPSEEKTVKTSEVIYPPSKGKIAIVGTGNYTNATILPNLKGIPLKVKYLVSSSGLSSTSLAKKYKIPFSSTDYDAVLRDDEIDHIIISTQHHLHASMTIKALKSGKNVFVEKPLCLNYNQLLEIDAAKNETGKNVVVGFNRRFSPHGQKVKQNLGNQPGPMTIIATMNAGYVPLDSWVHHPELGGGRIIGEACHYVDLISFFTESKVTEVNMQAMGKDPSILTDIASIHLKYENGSLGVINYFSNGHKSYPKERIEVYYEGKNMVIDNFRRLEGYGYGSMRTKQDKGHRKQFQLLSDFWQNGGTPLIPFQDLYNTTLATFAALESLQKGHPIKL